MNPSVDNRVVIVTGASRGLGKVIAKTFGKAGCRVMVVFRENEPAARATVDAVKAAGGDAISCKTDVRVSHDVQNMVDQALKQWGTIDVLVNNAGLTQDNLLLRMSEEQWDQVIDTNLSGAFHCIRGVAQHMDGRTGGHIINIASIVGLQGREGQANYSASKAGLIGLTKSCAKELGAQNIKVNVVLPGYLPTDMGKAISGSIQDRILREHALARFSDPQETADFIYHLSLMRNVSGQVFNLDSRVI
jgi:3-oxoacyl-[acyl-carrier protein] reductase